jgi:predicted metalloprotease with PDZ domain
VAAAPGFGGIGRFRLKGITHHIAWVGPDCNRTMKELVETFEKIAKVTLQMFGGAPFREYWFLLQFGHKLYGGLEHRDCQLTQFDGSALREQTEWNRFVKLVAHEYFHSWNVKSLRPLALGPFDYFKENYTQDIWFSEGITDYFDDILPLQAGLYSQEDSDKARLRDIMLFPDGFPGHYRRSLAEASFDAWIRGMYRPDEDSVNTDVSYYGKGAVLGWCWDAHLRKGSRGKWTLARLMREFWKEFGIDAYESLKTAQPGFTREQLLKFAEKKTGVAQRRVVENWVTQRKPLPWRQTAKFFGLKYSETVFAPALHFLGLVFAKGQITSVLSGGAAEEAGLSPHDEVIALNGVRVAEPEKFGLALKAAMREGKEIEVLVARLDRVLTRKIRWRKHDGMGVELRPV